MEVVEIDPEIVPPPETPAALVTRCEIVIAQLGVVVVEMRELIYQVEELADAARRLERRT